MTRRALALLGALAWSSPAAAAATVPLGSHDTVALGAWIEGGGSAVHHPGDEQPEVGGYLSKARVLGRFRHDDTVSGLLQVDLATGTPRLLDAVAEVHPIPELTLRAGRFKTPVSREFLEPGPELLFVHRPPTASVAPGRRVGAEIGWAPQLGDVRGQVQLGLFDDAADGILATGPIGVLRAGAELENGLGLHAAMAGPLARSEGSEAPVFDAAVTWEHGPARVLAEGAVALGPVGPNSAAVLQGGFRFGDEEHGAAFEPTLGIDVHAAPGAPVHPRLTTGLNVYLANRHLVHTIDLVVEPEPGGLSAGVFFQLRAAL